MTVRVRSILGIFRSSRNLLVVLAGTTLMAIGCESMQQVYWVDDPTEEGDDGPTDGGKRKRKKGADGGASDDGYDPETPTNMGEGLNPAGFASIAPILQRRCVECHHAGSWLDLTGRADEKTADDSIRTIEAGTMPPAPRDRVTADELAAIKAWRTGATPPPASKESGPSNVAIPQILDSGKLAQYKSILPKVAWPRLQSILSSPSTIFWDKAAMPPAYQDTVGNGADIPFGARLNSAGKSLIVPEGKKLFSDDGKTWAFPFGHTAGTDDATNVVIINFMNLPENAGALLPIAYRVEESSTRGLPISRWNWSFPKGTLIGEVVLVREGSSLLTTEIRVRERFADAWSTNIFRPFPTASVLVAAVKQKRPSWASTPALSAFVGALENNATLTAKRLDSPAVSNLVTLEGFVDAPLPELGDDALVRELLTTTTFVGAYGTSWKKDGDKRAFGATGPARLLSVVPTNFDVGLLEVRESTCTKCHDQGGTFIGGLIDRAVLYGDIWGVDRIFSFHPFEPSRIDASGNENRVVRASLSPIVQRYDAGKHPAGTYSFYRPK
jgi:hypothetical protein